MSPTQRHEDAKSAIRVKICGITNLEDALVAAEAGADYLGFIFYQPSKRSTTPVIVQAIVKKLRDLPRVPLLVGVFVNETASHMASILETCHLDLAQLSGDETPNLLGDPGSPLYGRGYKVLRPSSIEEGIIEAEWYQTERQVADQPSILIDSRHKGLYGGTGQISDWVVAAGLAREIPGLMLAGGLKPGNVVEAIRQVRPFAVDVASGVEASPGMKDHRLVRAFIHNARMAAASARDVD
jgi:phosphoribosylanthranilate isomerase